MPRHRWLLPLATAHWLLASLPSAQPAPGALRLFDSFTGAASGASVQQRTPERDDAGAGWRVDRPAGTPAGAPAPFTQAGRLLFPSGSAAVAVVRAPPGDRTLHTTVFQPAGHLASVTASFALRYVDPANALVLRVAWPASSGTIGAPAPDARVSLDHVAAGQTVSSQALGVLSHTVYARDLPLVVRSAGPLVEVWIDGRRIGQAAATAFADAPALAFSADTPPHPAAGGGGNGGTYARLSDVVVTTPAPPLSDACLGRVGADARSCVRAGFAPLRTYSDEEAFDHLFTAVWTSGTGAADRAAECVYGGATAVWSPLSPLSPRVQVEADGFYAESVWPSARRAPDRSPADLHTLALAFGSFGSARGARPFGDAFDHATQTARWLRGRTTRTASQGAPAQTSLYSRVERDFTRHPDDGDGALSLAELGRFDVRHARRGDVARQAAYALAFYRIEAEDGPEGRAFIEATLTVLLAWHLADPADDAERTRDDAAFLAQGNRNPFVSDPTLLGRAFYEASPDVPRVWINELHTTNAGLDVGEGVELAGPAGTDLYGYRVWTYAGAGTLYTADVDGLDGPSVAFRGTIDDEGGSGPGGPGLGAVWAAVSGLRGGCQGLALTDPAGRIVEFLSTGGCRFNALEGPVFDAADAFGASAPAHPDSLVWSAGIAGPPFTSGAPRRVQEWSTLPPGLSLQRAGAGRAAADFVWTGPLPASPGRLNDYQAPGARPGSGPFVNRVSGWTAGLPVALGLDAPIVDTGADDDRSADATAASEGPALRLGAPAPNPARTTVHVALDAPPGARLAADVVDALGRTVVRLSPASGTLTLDVSRLAAGVYVLRVSAQPAQGSPEAVSRRFTVSP